MKETSRYNIRYVGFQSLADGARRLDYAITAPGVSARSASIRIPAAAFSGTGRVTFQESATICCERIRSELQTQVEMGGANASLIGCSQQLIMLTLTAEDIEQFRPRRRAAGKRP